MKDEYFDIVDENNKPTGKKELRSKAHTAGLWHRTVHIYFFRQSESGLDFLAHLRAKHLDLHPNCWDTRFGGHLKAGETVEEAVVGEIKDETGLDIELSYLIKGEVYRRNKFPNREFTNVFYYQFNDDISSLCFEDDEVQEVKWMTVDEILDSMKDGPDKWSGRSENFKEVVRFLKNKCL